MTAENGNNNGRSNNNRAEVIAQSTLLTLAARVSSILATALIGLVAWLAVEWRGDLLKMADQATQTAIILSRTTTIQETLQRNDIMQDESISEIWRELRSQR